VATAKRHDGSPAARLLVGTRRYEQFSPLMEAAEESKLLVDLDDISRSVLWRDIEHYVSDLLGSTGKYRDLGGVRGAFANAVAGVLSARPAGPARDRWGEFLVAGLYTRFLVTSHTEPVTDSAYAEQLGKRVPRTLPEVLELDLAAQRTTRWLRPVLAALAFAQGQGMPLSVLSRAAAVFAADPGGAPATAEVLGALDADRFYLRQGTDTDHTTIYRLFHQGLADYLRQHPHPPGGRMPVVPERLLDALLSSLGPPMARDWDAAEPYLLRHSLQHAADAGKAGDLLADPGFLLSADPAVLTSAPAEVADRINAVVRASRAGDLRQRYLALACNAARAGLPDLAARAARPVGQPPLTWQPRWVVGQHVPPPQRPDAADSWPPPTRAARPAVASAESTGGPELVLCGMLDGRPIALTYSEADWLLVWDLLHSRLIGRLEPAAPDRPRTRVRAADFAVVDDLPIAVTCGLNGTIARWDLHARRQIGDDATKLGPPLLAVACTQVDGRPIAVTGDDKGAVQLWDLRDGTRSGFRLGAHDEEVRAVACTEVDGRPVAVTGSYRYSMGHSTSIISRYGGYVSSRPVGAYNSGTVRVWDLREGKPRGDPVTTGAVDALACTVVDGRPTAVIGRVRTARLWDLLDRQFRGPNLPCVPQGRIASGLLDGRPIAVTADSHKIRLWDLRDRALGRGSLAVYTTRTRRLQFAENIGGISAVIQDGRCLVAGAVYNGLRIWDLGPPRPVPPPDREAEQAALAGLRRGREPDTPVRLMRLAVIAGQRVVLTADDRGGVRVLELASGRLRYPNLLLGEGTSVADFSVQTLAGREVVAVATADGSKRIWDPASGKIYDTGGPAGWPAGEASRPDAVTGPEVQLLLPAGLVTATGSPDGTIRLAGGVSGDLRPGHDGPVTALAAVELAGRPLVFSGGADGYVRVWDASQQRQLDVIKMPAPVSASRPPPMGTCSSPPRARSWSSGTPTFCAWKSRRDPHRRRARHR
jgi:WD40 repeat protein